MQQNSRGARSGHSHRNEDDLLDTVILTGAVAELMDDDHKPISNFTDRGFDSGGGRF